MAEYLSPGVYVEEVNSGPRPIEGVGTAMAAFVGFAPAGDVNKSTLITNWSQYVEAFGITNGNGRKNPHLSGAYLSHAVYGYFLNGGGRCYVTRIASKAPKLQLPSRTAKGSSALALQAKDPGAGAIEVEVGTPTGEGAPEGSFTLRVKSAAVEEKYGNVTLGRSKGGLKNVAEAVQTSQLITVLEQIANAVPELGKYTLTAADTATLPAVQPSELKGDAAARTGIEGLEIA